MSRFHTLTIQDIKRETADAISIGFEIPQDLVDAYKYIQGQYVTLKFLLGGEEFRRSYSICSSPFDEGKLRVAVKKVKGGKVSSYLNDVAKTGDEVEVMTPMGGFHTELRADNKKNYVLFAGGSGITPMMSIMKAVLHAEPKSTLILFYGNNDEQSIIFDYDIHGLESQYPTRLRVLNIINTPPPNHPALLRGMMTLTKDLALIENYVGLDLDNEFFICGPTPMMDNVVAALHSVHVPSERIHIEYFSSPVETESEKKVEQWLQYKVGATLRVTMDGDEYQTIMLEGEAVLFAAKRIGLDAPYSCQNGSCSTCRAKLIEGKVHMKVNHALNLTDVTSGFILTCQSLPLTDEIVVSYDQAI